MSDVTLGKAELQELIEAVVRAAKAPGVLEQRAMDEDIERQKRRDQLAIELGYAEQLKMWNQQQGCTHSRYSMGAGKLAGHGCKSGQGEWTTGGQLNSNGNASLVCLRCGTNWIFIPTANEKEYAEHEGFLGFQPPPIDRCLNKDSFVKAPPALPALN